MDRAHAIGDLRSPCRAFVCHNRACEPWSAWIDNRRADVAGLFRDPWKRPAHRNRSALRFALRARNYFLAEFLARKEISLADLDHSIRFSWARLAREGPRSSFVFLRRCDRRDLEGAQMESVASSRAFRRHCYYARDFRGLGDPIC